ncbi:hypothetical protein ROZALSC1DRAFT_23179 [Rozella allomycis CSF55]|uniref:Uncharacterized protein n=1 Tax=Rozella allomycis (strain CSF55) TaxID=988480 RepID=A0A4P9YJD3_ROZAC|nr:hypothetical protein ROZALSC1DRAFT_23179 [Rozella allomycis CSF55]
MKRVSGEVSEPSSICNTFEIAHVPSDIGIKLVTMQIRKFRLKIADFKNLLGSNHASDLMMRMSAYSANITGSHSFWYYRRVELEHISLKRVFEHLLQKGVDTVFWTASYSDNHLYDLHRLMPLRAIRHLKDIEIACATRVFEICLKEFLKALVDATMDLI